MKIQKRYYLVTFLTAGLIMSVASAEETTGEILEDLVAQVDNKLAVLEENIQKKSEQKVEAQSELAKLKSKYDGAQTESDKIGVKVEIVEGLKELNTDDRSLIKETMETIVSIDGDLQELSRVYEDGFMGKESLDKQRGQIRNVIQSVGPILLGLKKPIHVLQLGASVDEIVNMAAVAVIDAQQKQKR